MPSVVRSYVPDVPRLWHGAAARGSVCVGAPAGMRGGATITSRSCRWAEWRILRMRGGGPLSGGLTSLMCHACGTAQRLSGMIGNGGVCALSKGTAGEERGSCPVLMRGGVYVNYFTITNIG